jgi:hypothetical protein
MAECWSGSSTSAMAAAAASACATAFPTPVRPGGRSRRWRRSGCHRQGASIWARWWTQCYLCDVCFMTKCPYVPPHEWNIDFPHLMLRAKAIGSSRKARAPSLRQPGAGQHRCPVGKPLASLPRGGARWSTSVNRSDLGRKALAATDKVRAWFARTAGCPNTIPARAATVSRGLPGPDQPVPQRCDGERHAR